MNSCRPQLADELVDQALQREFDLDCFPFMERMYDCFGINSDIKGADLWVLTPGDNMLGALPGLDEEGMTVTYNRKVALDEGAHFLSWEHPLVRNAIDSILSTEFGNTALVAMKYEGLQPGKLLLDCRFVIELADDQQVHGHRYFPDASISIVIDEQGQAWHLGAPGKCRHCFTAHRSGYLGENRSHPATATDRYGQSCAAAGRPTVTWF